MFLKKSEIELEYDENVIPLTVDCSNYVREKFNKNVKYSLYHNRFGKRKNHAWPMTTDLACLHCSYNFSTQPVPLVKDYDELKNIFYTYGQFCSINCVKSYIIEHENNISTKRMLFFNHMIRNVFDVKIPVKPAPPRIRLEKFGGDLSIDDFRNNFTFVSCKELNPPFISSSVVFEDTPDQNNEKMDTSSAIFNESKLNEEEEKGLYNAFYNQMEIEKTLEKTLKNTSNFEGKANTERKNESDLETKEKKGKKRLRFEDNEKKNQGNLNAFLKFS